MERTLLQFPSQFSQSKTSTLATSSMAFNRASSSSSFSSSFTDQWAHDVFLSFRGEDTRNNFTAHLHAALLQNGINTYIDNDLKRGENISPALINAIKESRISVIVLSQNYASSSWCLDELAMILECKETKGQIVLPVFYKVDPSEVRHKKRSFEEAFAKHEERFKDNQIKVQRWKEALTKVADLAGYHLGNRNEHDFIKEIIDGMNSILVKETKFQVAQYLVGIESQVQAVKLLLDIEKKDSTCMVGIFGTGGIGKTTLAKAIFNSIAFQFEGSCFLRDIRETVSQTGGLIRLQKELLSNILSSSLMFDDVDQGVNLIEKRLHLKRILLVLDDVDQSSQLEKLVGKTNWFGLGSKIIITTRDKHLLCAHDRVDSAYEVKLLDHHEALQLFSWNAFSSDKPSDGYEEVTEDAVSYCGGLPLALTVVGSALKGKDIVYWESQLDEYKRIPDKKIQKILKISYDSLECTEKEIFLDIACFFKGEKLEEYGFFPYHVIQVLVNKSLISIMSFERRLIMHDLLQEMGREIVRNESPDEAGERSRLWFHEDVLHVLEDKTGTNKVKGILIDFPEPDLIHLSPKAFKKMKSLRLIIIRSAHFSEEPTFLSNELRLIDWHNYPGESFPSNFHGNNLVVLRMPHSHFRELKALQLQKLTIMDFSDCNFLEKIPDVSRLSNLKSLKLVSCKNLVEVDRSVGLLDKLAELDVSICENLRSFPKSLRLRSLKSIKLFRCPRLKNFPEIECKMECLEFICSNCTSIKELTSSICLLLEDNRQSIRSISSGTELLQQLPLTNISDSNDDSFSNVFPKLRNLYLGDCALSESNFFRMFDCASMLSSLSLSGSDIVSLPRCIESLAGLNSLCLTNCKQLKEILGLPRKVIMVEASGCVSLEIFLEDHVGVEAVSPTRQSLERKFQFDFPSNMFRFCILNLQGCMQLREIPKLPPIMNEVYLGGCTSLERLPFNNIYHDLPYLQRIDCSDCPEHIRNDLQIQLFSKGHPTFLQFESRCHCIYPGNMIPDCFSYRKEVLNTNSCEIDMNGPHPFDVKNTIFAFSAVIGFRTEDGQDGDGCQIVFFVINDSQEIYSHYYLPINIARSDHVCLFYTGSDQNYQRQGSKRKANIFRVEFTLRDKDYNPFKSAYPLKSAFLKSCGFDIVHFDGDDDVGIYTF